VDGEEIRGKVASLSRRVDEDKVRGHVVVLHISFSSNAMTKLTSIERSSLTPIKIGEVYP
jgi:hypothetical protein